mmetsp:Transcript_10581/g.20822  ORF Transcript_10581/g.20822 Transcript_10581/m.20822 type:complete len:223 (+) Transcript_10581:595-1263(+)
MNNLIALLVLAFNGNNLCLEFASLSGSVSALLGFVAKVVEFLTGELVLLGQELSTIELRKCNTRALLLNALGLRGEATALLDAIGDVGADRDISHGLDTTSNNNILNSAHNGHGSKMKSLLRATALAINTDTRHRFGDLLRGQHNHAANVAGLHADLVNTATDNIVNLSTINSSSGHQLIADYSTKISGVPLTKSAILAAAGSAAGFYNVGSVGHLCVKVKQ